MPNDHSNGNGDLPRTSRAAFVDGGHGVMGDGNTEESTRNAAREIRQDTMQAPPILSAADVAMLDYFFDAPDDFEDLSPATDVTTLRFTDAETAVIRDFFQTVEVISARARARAR